MASYHLLCDDGKISICAENNDCQLVSYYCKNTRDDISFNTEEIAKLLLAKEDAWTMKNNFCLFNNDFSREPLFVKSSPKGRRSESTGNSQQEASSQLAHVLKITINELRSSISIGRSLLDLAQYTDIFFKDDIFDKKLKEPSSVTTRLHAIQCFCLMNAIEVLSCSATYLEYILSLDKLDEEDLDESAIAAFSHDALIRQLTANREESSPLLSVTGILSADAWFSFGKLTNKTSKVGRSDALVF